MWHSQPFVLESRVGEFDGEGLPVTWSESVDCRDRAQHPTGDLPAAAFGNQSLKALALLLVNDAVGYQDLGERSHTLPSARIEEMRPPSIVPDVDMGTHVVSGVTYRVVSPPAR